MTKPTDDGKFEKDQGDVLGQAQNSAIADHIVTLLEAGRKIAAIKLYRRQTGASLNDAKNYVEALAAKHGINPKGVGCAGMVLLLVVVSTIIGMWPYPVKP